MIHIKEAIVVEGKYDRERLRQITDAPVVCTHGFQLYRSRAILESIRQFAKTRGVIILTDSDRAGFQIRSYLRRSLGPDCVVKNAYIPALPGKERRKEKPGKEGILGVEGMTPALLAQILQEAAAPAAAEDSPPPVTKAQFFADGLSGHPDSAQRRAMLIRHLHLPPRLSANALLALLNQTGGCPVYRQALKELGLNKN